MNNRPSIAGHLVDGTSGKAVASALVEAWERAEGAVAPIASASTDRRGAFSLSIEPRDDRLSTVLALYVFDATRMTLLVREPTLIDTARPLEELVIRTTPVEKVEPETGAIDDVAKRLGLELPPALTKYLRGRGIETLDDLRLKGGLFSDAELPIDAGDPVVGILDAHAALTLLATDTTANAALIEAGFHDVTEIARAPRQAVADALKDTAPSDAAAIHAIALDQSALLQNLIAEARVSAAFGESAGVAKAIKEALPKTCSCPACQDATGLIAYLVDLLDYTIRHVRNNGQPITLTFLQDRFHQPFRDLPATCDEVQRKVRRVRIAVEILRQHLGGRVPARYPETLEAAYRALLENIGTSFDELRQMLRARPQEQARFTERLMIPPAWLFQNLFKDPNAAAGDPLELTEAWLNQMFGLRSTTIGPLADAASPTAGSPAWMPDLLLRQRRFLWDQWYAEDQTAASLTLDGRPFIDPDVIDVTDLVDVTRNPVPRALRPNRVEWSVLDFLDDRQAWIDTTIGELRTNLAGPAAGLEARLTALLQALQAPATSFPDVTRTGMAGLTFAVVRGLYLRQVAGVDVSSNLSPLEISPEELDALGRVLHLAALGDPILSLEWDDFYSVIIGRLKRFGFHAVWKDQERRMQVTIDREPPPLTGLTLSPYHFHERTRSALGASNQWRPKAWRSTEVDRRRWEELLQSRVDRFDNLVTVLQGAVDAAEVIELPALRDLFLRTAVPPGVFLIASTKRLTDWYQIDFQEGACAFTTRIAQAIRTLQGVLFGLRNGLLDDPALSLDDERFDEVWQWLGTYATWKAATLVFLYPETVARPTLLPRPSPGFVEFVAALRSMGKLTPATAREAVALYEDYFVDVCTLGAGFCVTAPAPGPASGVFYNYLVARSASGRLYWCHFDFNDNQSYWRRLEVPGFDESPGPFQLFGAAYYARDADECFLYVFAKQEGRDSDRLIFARTNLRQSADWERLTWQNGVLEPLPAAATHIAFARVLTDRSQGEPIKLCIWLTDRDAYIRPLNAAGGSWDPATPFSNVPVAGAWSRLGPGTARNGADFACSTQQIPPKFVLAGDFDRDGRDEIAVIPNRPGTEGNDIWMLKYNAAAGAWQHVSPIPDHPFDADIDIGAIDPPARFAVAGDFDGDGFPEIAIAADLSAAGAAGNIENLGFWVRKFDPASGMWSPLGTSGGSFPYGLELASQPDAITIIFRRLNARFAVVGDFDGDQRDEIAIALDAVPYVGIPGKGNANTFLVFDLELRSGGNHLWNRLPDLLCEPPAEIDVLSPKLRFARFAVAGRFRPSDDRDLILVSKKLTFTSGGGFGQELDPNLGNDFWTCRFDGTSWQTLDPPLDCADIGVAARFGVVGDFDGDSVPEVAIAQAELLPGSNSFGFWIEKMDMTGAWTPLPPVQYGARAAVFAVAGDFDADGADELAVVTPDVWTTNIQVFDLNNGAWQILQGANANILVSGGGLTGGVQPGQMPGDEFVVSGVGVNLVPTAGGRARQLVMFALPGTDNTARAYVFDTLATGNWAPTCDELEVRPAFPAARPMFAGPDIDVARALNGSVPAALGSLRRRTNQAYLDEMLYFLPMEVAIRLRENGAYRDALDWCRLVYDYGAPPNQRLISAKLIQDNTLPPPVYLEWLEDTLNPHAIAETRKGAYFKFTILLICRCLIDWADAEFSKADDQSIRNAAELYERARDLLGLPEIRQRTNECDELISWLTRTIGSGERLDAYEGVFRELHRIDDPALLAGLTERIAAIASSDANLPERITQSLEVVTEAAADVPPRRARTFETLQDETRAVLKAVSTSLTADATRSAILKGVARSVRSSREGGAAVAQRMRRPMDESSQQYRPGRDRFIPAPIVPLCIPPNPALIVLRRHVELCLQKIRDCRNIAGLELCCTMEDSFADDSYGLQPLPYRYATLIERTKQLVELARQMESSMLQFISSAEQERYQELKARQDLELTQAGVRLKELQVVQANDTVVSAMIQRDRAERQVSHYSDLLGNGLSVNEQLQVSNLIVADIHQHATAIAAWVEAAYGIGSYSSAISSSGAAWAINSQYHALMSSFERRTEEWTFERSLANQDLRAGRQQIVLARDQVALATEERSIAALQAAHAETVVDFLATKFLSADLYEWMADVLQQVYRFFLQQATQLARLAELQLAFERQEPVASLIKADYWERPSNEMTPDVGASSTGTNSVRGLTGSARLLRDVYELDQYAFTKDQRKQQVSETFSLAELDPFAFQTFRQTGRLPFATPMSLFSRRLPGHYLRLVKRVRSSVIALIPPTMGIRATLASIGPTRVTIGGDVFRTVTVRRNPEIVTLTSSINSTGLFDVDAQPELLVPFEGIGVDGHWVFDMPKASNPFDYDAIADVLVTFDYTALYSATYHEQQLKTMDRRVGAERAFGFRNEFADAWYDLNNPEIIDDPDAPMTVRFRTRRADFPPNLSQLTIGQVLLQFVQKPATRRVVNVDALYYVTASSQEFPANAAQRSAASDADGLISTRRGALTGLVGGPIDGDLTWTLSLPDALKARFKNEEIIDILLVIAYAGVT